MELDESGKKTQQLAQKAYEAYCHHTGWKSAVTGDPLPQWTDLRGGITNAWFAAAKAVQDAIHDA